MQVNETKARQSNLLLPGKKGGALASAIHSYIQHGAPAVRYLVHHMLALVAQPIFALVTRWIYDGELEDQYHEVSACSLWKRAHVL